MAEEVVVEGAGHAVVVHAAVVEEAAVLDGGDGLDEALRDFVVGDEAAFGAVLVFGERGDELGLELVGGKRGAVVSGDGLDFPLVVTMVAPSVEWKDCGPGLMEMVLGSESS